MIYEDPGSAHWIKTEEKTPTLVGYGPGLGRQSSHDPKIDGPWHTSFNSIMKEIADASMITKDTKPIQPITKVVTATDPKSKVLRNGKRINMGQKVIISQKPAKPITKKRRGLTKDQQTDFGTGKVPSKLKRIKDNFESL